jgi:outer membrane protein TolC
VLVTLTADVASIYVQIRTIQTQLQIAHENIERQLQALDITHARFIGGVVTGRDVDQAKNILGSTQAMVPQLAIQIEQLKDALCVLIGRPPEAIDEILTGSSVIPTAPEHVAVGIPADLLRRRPDVRKELTAAAQCAQIGFAKADLFPIVSLTGAVGTVASNIGSNNLSKLFIGNSLLFSTGPPLVWNIFNYGQITNNVRVQDARFQEFIVEYQNSVLKAQQEVDTGLTS